MSYLLFCAEPNNQINVLSYKNQTGSKTEPFEKNNSSPPIMKSLIFLSDFDLNINCQQLIKPSSKPL